MASLLTEEPCMIVFCTADPTHALEEFDLDAVDYLPKPIDLKRLSHSLDKFRSLNRGAREAQHAKYLEMGKPIMLNDGDNGQLFTPGQIETVVSIGNYVKLKGDELSIIAQYTLSYLESRLNKDIFFRANTKWIAPS